MKFSELEGARIGVWGAGREISSFASQVSARLPRARIDVAVFDERAPAELPGGAATRAVRAVDAVGALAACDVLVRSPGVTVHRAEMAALRERGTAVVTATGLWLAEVAGRGVLAVTGTKGKSTTAALAAHVAARAGVDVALAGNIGAPALDLLGSDHDLVVLELSSFQIADLQVGAETVVVTNLYREHLDWHGSDEDYTAEKLRLLDLPGVESVVLNGRDERLMARAGSKASALFGIPGGWDVDARGLVRRERVHLPADELPLAGEHNALNLAGALAGLEAAGVEAADVGALLAGFTPLPHRLEVVRSDGVVWVNDSISTTPESAIAALRSFPDCPLVLIAGGQDRGQDYAALARELAACDAALVAVPTTGPRLAAAALDAGARTVVECAGLEEAVAVARELAAPGAVVLLSPAAPSFDNFRDFEQRGERFAALAGA